MRTRAGRPIAVRRVVASNGEEINGVQVAADPLGGWVVAERQFRRTRDRFYYVRAMTLDAAGRLAGAVQDLGPGEFGIDARPTQALAVGSDGRAVLAFVREARFSQTAPAPTVMVATRPHGGAFGTPVALPGDTAADPRVAVGAGGRALVAATQARNRGDAGVFGDPVVARLGPAGALGTPFGPALSNPRLRVRAERGLHRRRQRRARLRAEARAAAVRDRGAGARRRDRRRRRASARCRR